MAKINHNRPNNLTYEKVVPYENKLPDHWYQVLVYRALGNDYATIAQLLEIPLGSVKSRLHRSKKMIESIVRAEATKT